MPHRIQADLMGHKFQRPIYGDGGTLAERKKKHAKVKLKPH
jgi:hypothetical protein